MARDEKVKMQWEEIQNNVSGLLQYRTWYNNCESSFCE